MSPLELILAVGLMVAGISYAAAQFFSGRRKGLGEALETASKEIDLLARKIQRLEDEMHKQAQETAELRAENVTLRSLLAGGSQMRADLEQIAKDSVKALEKFATAEHEKTRRQIERIHNDGP